MLRQLSYQLILVLIGYFSSATAQTYNMPGGTISTCSGSFFDTGGSGLNYGNNVNVTTTFCSSGGNCIQVVFTAFNTESCCDKLLVYDGPNTSSPLRGTYSGTTLPNGGTITSSTGCLTFVFTSDGSVVSTGWAASFSCVACPPPTCTDGIQNGAETSVDCGGTCPTCYNMPGGTVSTCSGNFFDDGGSAGDHGSSDITTTFCSNSGNCIKVAFSTFNLISGLGFLKVYNGSSTGAPLIGSYTGTSLPNGGTITSATCCLTFEFTNGGSATVSSGWAAAITCVTCAVPTCVDGVQNGTETGVDCGGSCSVCPPPTIPTCNNYGTTGEDIFRSIIQTSDGGYAMVGTAKISPHPVRKILIVKTDNTLKVSWSKIIQTLDGDPVDLDGSGVGADGYQVVQTADGGYAIAGGAYNTNNGLTHQGIVVKLDASGNLLWTQSYGSTSNDHFESIAKTTDGGFICAGHTGGFGAGADDLWIVKLTSIGAISWTRVVGTVGTDVARKVIQTSDGGYAVVGQSQKNGGFSFPEIYVVKLTSAGAVSWTRHIENAGEDYTGYSIYQTTDGGYAVAGRRNKSGAGGGNFFYVAKLTSGGGVSWTSALNDPSTSALNFANYHATSVIQNTAGNIVAAGRFASSFHYVAELNNTTGAIISTLKLPYQPVGVPPISDDPAVIIQTTDGGYAMGAAGARPISPFDNQFLFAKLSAVSVAGSCATCSTSTGGTRVSLGGSSSSGSNTTGGTTFPPTVAISSFTFPCVSSTCVNCAIPVAPPPGCSAVLSIKLLSFTANCNENNTVEVNWSTATETNNDFFTIERSTEAVNFEPVGKIKGAGNSNIMRNYQYIDATSNLEPQTSNTLYYRLKQNDFDGQFEYFDVIAVKNCEQKKGTFNIYPNPANHSFSFISQGSNGVLSVEVYNHLGAEVIHQAYTNLENGTQHTIETNGLAQGVYLVKFSQGVNQQTSKLIINR